MSHPNLSDSINANLIKNEILGGVWLTMPSPEAKVAYAEALEKGNVLKVGKVLRVKTANILYLIEKRQENELWISGHPKYCPFPVRVNIHGSTFGGSMLKIGYIGRDMHLEFSLCGAIKTITTTLIEDITEV